MAFSDYTNPDSVRAVLGISVKEVSDAKITDNVYLTTLLEALHALSPTLKDDYLEASVASPRTAKQNRFVLLAETLCTYVVAQALIPGLRLAAPQVITDGKTSINRVADPYTALEPAISASIGYYKQNLMEAYADINVAITAPVRRARTMVLAVGLAVDPVTGA